MAVIEDPASGNTLSVDPSKLAARVNLRPIELTGQFGIGAQSGALAGVAAGAPLFSLRNGGGNGEVFVVRRVGLGFITTAAFTTAQVVDFGLYAARGCTASDSGGTQVSFAGSNQKLRTSLVAPNGCDARISAAVALTAGTRTLDPVPLGQVGFFSNAAGAALTQPWTANLWDQYAGDHQIVLAPNEGLVVVAMTAFGAAGVGRLYLNVEFAVAGSY